MGRNSMYFWGQPELGMAQRMESEGTGYRPLGLVGEERERRVCWPGRCGGG